MIYFMKELKFLNEKGNPKASVRKQAKEQSMDMVKRAVSSVVENDVEETARNTLSVQIGVDESTGQPVYFEIEGKITTTDPSYKPERKSSKKEPEEEETIDLFSD